MGEHRTQSDVDLLGTPGTNATLFDVAQFKLDMEALLGVPASVTSSGCFDPLADQDMFAEAIAL